MVEIIISFVAAMAWSIGYGLYAGKLDNPESPGTDDLKHIYSFGFIAKFKAEQISPFLMIVVGMGLVYAIYPGIAPGMIVPFYLVDKIETVLLIATIFPPVIIAALRKTAKSIHGHWSHYQSPMCLWGPDEQDQQGKWTNTGKAYSASSTADSQDASFWHAFDLLIVLKISLAVIFIYSFQYTPHNKFAIILVRLISSDSMFFQVYTSLIPTVLRAIPLITLMLLLSVVLLILDLVLVS